VPSSTSALGLLTSPLDQTASYEDTKQHREQHNHDRAADELAQQRRYRQGARASFSPSSSASCLGKDKLARALLNRFGRPLPAGVTGARICDTQADAPADRCPPAGRTPATIPPACEITKPGPALFCPAVHKDQVHLIGPALTMCPVLLAVSRFHFIPQSAPLAPIPFGGDRGLIAA
jgi:hypothetical protein